ncbi:MAG: hypothetical protein V4695_01175 [Pseudomonadota bacterium]
MLTMVDHTSTYRLSREQFRALAREKGWKFKMLAERWGVSPEWVSIVSRDPNRDIRFDDALFGLPNLRHLARDLRRRELQVDEAMARYRFSQAATRKKAGLPGYRYQGYLNVGAIVTTVTQFGTVAEEGTRGVVFDVRQNSLEEIYGVIFEQGATEWFTPALVDIYLAGTGLVATAATSYCYLDSASLRVDFEMGRFDFDPVGISSRAG